MNAVEGLQSGNMVSASCVGVTASGQGRTMALWMKGAAGLRRESPQQREVTFLSQSKSRSQSQSLVTKTARCGADGVISKPNWGIK